MQLVIAIIVGLAVGVAGAVVAARLLVAHRLAAGERDREQLVEDSRRAADGLRREAQVEAREQAVKLRAEVEEELGQRRAEVIKIEERVLAKEEDIDRKLTELDRREQSFADREAHVRQLQEELKAAKDGQIKELERISGMTVNEAKKQLLEQSEELVRHELARMVRQAEEEAQADAKHPARNLH